MVDDLRDILRNRLKEKLARDEVVASMTVRLCRSIEIARIAATSGFDTIYVDVEHNTLSIDAVCQICIAAMAHGITPLVRVTGQFPGVHLPAARRWGDGRDRAACAFGGRGARYSALREIYPAGRARRRGAPPHYHYRSFPSAMVNQAMNDATMVVVMMETVAALDHIEEIAAVDGVDIVLIGTNDLCNEMGITGQFDHANVRDAYLRTIAACRKHGKHVGVGGLASRRGPDGRVCAAGGAICVHRHGSGVPAGGLGGEGEVRAGHSAGIARSIMTKQ